MRSKGVCVAPVLCVQDAQVYMFDEPSSFLDVKQRITAAQTVRSLQTVDNYIVVVESGGPSVSAWLPKRAWMRALDTAVSGA